MSTVSLIGNAFIGLMNPTSLILIVVGVGVGIVFGSIPGLSAAMAVALFLPVTFAMESHAAFVLLVSLYIGGISGGLISAILLNIPGTSSSIATCFDGSPMAKKGEAAKVAVRNIRRDANDALKKWSKAKEISEDEADDLEKAVQKLTDKFITEVDKAVDTKTKEVLTV